MIRADGAPSRPARGGRGSFKEKPTNLLFLNFEGAALVSGNDDPVEGKSTVLSLQGVSQADMPAFDSADYYDLNDFSTREEQIHAVAGMVRRLFAPFDVEVVTERPSDAVPYSMVIVGGDVSLLNMPSGVLGVGGGGIFAGGRVIFMRGGEGGWASLSQGEVVMSPSTV